MTFKFKIQPTPGALFWANVTKMLKENKKSLRSVALYMRDGVNDKKTLALYDKLYRYKREAINPPNVLANGVLNYLKKFDEYLMFSETREDYNALMSELSTQGCRWHGGRQLHELDGFEEHESKTILKISYNVISYFSMDFYKQNYNECKFIEYKAEKDTINPNHYEFGGMEARHFLDKVFEYGEFEAWQAPYVSNAIEYIVRAPRKNGLEDFKKARRNLDILIEKMEVEND